MGDNKEVKRVIVWIHVVYIQHICFKYDWKHNYNSSFKI